MSEDNSLFDDFSANSESQWREKIIADLKGKDFDDTLVWEDENGIRHQPIYTASTPVNEELLKAIQNAQHGAEDWRSIQLFSSTTEQLKTRVLEAFSSGVDEVVIDDVRDSKALKKMLGDELSTKHHLHFLLTDLAKNHTTKRFYADPIKEMIEYGQVNDEDFTALNSVFQKRLNHLNPNGFLLVDGTIYKNAGATIVQELALILHHSVEYFDQLTEAGFSEDAIARSFTFKHAVGTSYFSEIAKTRALRYLIAKLFDSYGVQSKTTIWGEASSYYHAHKDAHTNLLRLSSQAMSLIVGNCDFVSLPTFDELEKSSTLGYRTSKNIPLILKSESYFQEVKDMAAGSYYIDYLSVSFVEKAWDLFLVMESQGGLFAKMKNGSLRADLAESRLNREKTYTEANRVQVGVNKYENANAVSLKVKKSENKGLNSHVLSNKIEG